MNETPSEETLVPDALWASDAGDEAWPQRVGALVPVVALGASAGGIAALQEFFAAMPADSGMAFVVILHLSPTHESTLAKMFQRSTSMPVVDATDGARVRPNFVYVIPPGRLLAFADGHLVLHDAQPQPGKRVAVDSFFRSLAQAHGAQALAVVLSGSGGDGALGLGRIKELGGLTVVQDPDEAEHPQMPRAAIATGLVDWVLKVKEMPAKLQAYVEQSGRLDLPDDDGPHPSTQVELAPEEKEAAFRDTLAYLHTRTGHDFSSYKRATIVRRIARRMQVNGLGNLKDYLFFLRTNAGEATALLQELLISVTNFFREPASFAALERIIPDLFKGKQAGDTVRVWVPACATGEEAYSIAILLCEHAQTLVGPPQLQIFATDLDDEVVQAARDGLYPETIVADVSEERLRQFFIQEPGGYRVRRAVRELILFGKHDLLRDSPFSRLDLISCRNLLIYLNREGQSRAFDIFHFALRQAGRLFLGTAESVEEGSPLFAALDPKQRLYVRRQGPPRLIALPAGPGTLARALALQQRIREAPTVAGRQAVEPAQAAPLSSMKFEDDLPHGQLHYQLIERLAPPSVLVDSSHDIVHLSESAGRFLRFAGGEPSRNLLRVVLPSLRIELRAALYAAARTRATATASRIPFEVGDQHALVDLRVIPWDLAPDVLLVVFEEHPVKGAPPVASPDSAATDPASLHLERELEATKQRLRDTVEHAEASTEELKASNEELQAMNEELRSATEELETSREELQSLNEELTTVNDELKSNLEQLARSNNDLQNLMTATGIATVFLDRELRVQRFTPSAKALFNFISTDLGRPLSDLTRELDYPQLVDDAEGSLTQLRPTQRDVRAGERWYKARTLPYRTVDDRIAGVVLTFFDITEQKRGEENIARLAAESERRRRLYEAVLKNTPDLMYVFGLDHRLTYANDSQLATWGLDREGAIGKTLLELGYEPWHAAMHDREIDQVRATRHPVYGEVPFNGVNGPRQYDYAFVPILGSDGQVEAVAGTIHDVTERKANERQLREGQQQLDFALAAADLGYWALTLADRTAQRTLRHDQIFGYDALLPEWTFERFLAHVVQDDRAAVEAGFRTAVENGSTWATECRIRRADGVVRHIWTKGLVRRAEGGQAKQMLGIVGDITALRESEGFQAFLNRLADALRPVGDPIEVQARASQVLGEQLAADRVAYWQVDGEHYVVERDYTHGLSSIVGRVPLDASGAALLERYRAGETAVETDADTRASRSQAEEAAYAALQVRSFIGVPLVKDGVFVAGLAVHSATVRAWTPAEVAIVEETAERTWAAIERVRAEAALRRSEERSAFVRKSSGVGFWYCDLPFDVLQWDELVKAHFHLPPEASITIHTFYERMHPEDREPTRLAIEKSIAQHLPYDVEYRTVDPDTGAQKWIRALGRTGYAANGTPAQFDGVTLDVSEQKRAEATLRESEDRFRRVADAAPVLIWLSGADALCSWFNRPWLDFRGRTLEQEIGEGWTQGIHPDDRTRCLETYRVAFDSRSPFSMEYRLRRHDGQFRWVVDNGVPRLSPRGEFEGYIGSCLDVTDYKNAESGLRDADRRKDEFLATLAHELRNPLAPIRNGLQVIRLAGENATVERARSMMDRQLTQLVRLVDDLLDVSRVTSGKLELRREQVEVQAVVDAAVETSGPVIEQAGHQLTVSMPQAPIWVDGDLTRLAQVVSNLLNNSAKYTQQGGNIALTVRSEGGQAVVSVADDGIGIPPSMLDSVFELFTQVDRTLEKTTGGLGIGLSLVKGLIGMHGGTIEARSEGEGRGSEFVVRLPEVAPAVHAVAPPEAKGPISAPSRLRLLVADDNVDSAEMLGELLEMLGNEVRTANDGLQAVEVAEAFRPDLVLLDIGMPKLNGYEAARRIRSNAWGRGAVLVALTGWGKDEDRRKTAEAGFDHHLVKPVQIAVLKKVLADVQAKSGSKP